MEAKKRTGGFTLIELIVVIAILGILAGVGTVAYTGYVKRANKGVDQQMVTDVVNSIYYAWMANPNGQDYVGAVVLSKDGTPSIPNETLKSGVQMAFGDLSQLTLKYDWGNNSAVLTNVAAKVSALKTALDQVKTDSDGKVDNISFVNDSNQILDDMFDALTSETASNIISAFDDDTSASNVLNSAAKYTLAGDDASIYALFNDGTALADAWNTMDWESGFTNLGENEVYYDVAAMGMNAARTYSLALYLQNHADTLNTASESSEDIQNTVSWLLNAKAAGNIVSSMTSGTFNMSDAQANGLKAPHALTNAVNSYFGANVLAYSGGSFSSAGGTPSASSQAYADGLGYAAAMTTIKDLSNDTTGMDDNTYFNTITGGVNTAVAMMNNDITEEDIQNLQDAANGTGNNNVVITVLNMGGKLNISVSPADAYLGSVGEVEYENGGTAEIPEVPGINYELFVVARNAGTIYCGKGTETSSTSLNVKPGDTLSFYITHNVLCESYDQPYNSSTTSVDKGESGTAAVSNCTISATGLNVSGNSVTIPTDIMNGTYMITLSHNYDGISKTGTFSIIVSE